MSGGARPLFAASEIPSLVTDETITVPRGETLYTIDLTDDEVELLAAGVCPERMARRCFEMLSWKREYARNCARESAVTP